MKISLTHTKHAMLYCSIITINNPYIKYNIDTIRHIFERNSKLYVIIKVITVDFILAFYTEIRFIRATI